MKAAALCAGYGGLEMGLAMAGVEVELAWYAEIDKSPSEVMAHHHPCVPNLGDLTEIADPPKVDIVTAGFPCQPVSTAGKRKGIHDERWLIDDVCKVASGAGARWLVLENVAGILTANRGAAFYQVLRALAQNGFAARWTCLRAADVGAPHGRLRWFCLAHADDRRRKQCDQIIGRLPVIGEDNTSPADADGAGHGKGQDVGRVGRVDRGDAGPPRERKWSRSVFGDRSDAAAPDADLPRRGEHGRAVAVQASRPAVEHAGDHLSRFGPYAAAVARWEPVVGRPAPDPTDDKRRLNPAFVEWMMGLPAGWVTEPLTARSKALKVLGNGVVPQQAAAAIRLLDRQVAS